ncbi:MAG: lipoyl(octanoyl) transferase LipB [Opitutales bacterium]|nr:lipoyl(octanoyl) transferase LipB [Opitutales bacterium]
MDTPKNSPCHPLQIIDWGETDYADAFERQKAMVDQRRADTISDTLIFTEHKPVYTLGLRKGAEQHLIWSEAVCAEQGISVHRSNRGGDITYHGPGQIVGYPIISLQARRDLHAYLRDLEAVVINALAQFGLETDRREGKTGIWLGERKICAIGVAVRSWVTYHGFALNVSPNMQHFNGIVPCGITDGTVTSMELELGQSIDLDTVKSALAVEFQKVFENTPRTNG